MCLECGKEYCGCGTYLRQFGTEDIPKELLDWMVWDELEAEHPHSRKWFEVVLRAVLACAQDQVDWLSTEYAAEFGPDDEDAFSAEWDIVRDDWEALKKTAGIGDGVNSNA